jgi:hypothetical protein
VEGATSQLKEARAALVTLAKLDMSDILGLGLGLGLGLELGLGLGTGGARRARDARQAEHVRYLN